MSSISLKNTAGVVFPPSNIENLKGRESATLGAEKVRLKKATREFESFFLYYMMKAMRKTIPENPFTENSASAGGMGKEVFEQLFDMEIARRVADGGPKSISSLLYESVEKLLTAQYTQSSEKPSLKSLKSDPRQPIDVNRRPVEFEPSKPRFREVPKTGRFSPISHNPQKAGNDKILQQFGKQIDQAAKLTSLDPALIYSIIKVESNGDASAVSEAGARGLMQLADSTASDYGVQKIFNPAENIRAGSSYLRDLLKRFGSLKLALAAYNAGPGNVEKYGEVPPFRETQQYIRKVSDTLRDASELFDNKRTQVL